ncbi:MAG: hypothetical protein ACK56F_10590 [bacterium]
MEKTGKSEHLSVIFEPLGLNPRNVIINGLFSLLLEVGGRLAFKLVQKGTRKRFFYEICFFTNFILKNITGLVFYFELLGFVVVQFVRVRELKPGQKWDCFRHVNRTHCFLRLQN